MRERESKRERTQNFIIQGLRFERKREREREEYCLT